MLKRSTISRPLQAARTKALKKPSEEATYSITPAGVAALDACSSQKTAVLETGTLDEMLAECITDGELGRAARRAYSVLEDRAAYRVAHVEAALLAYLPIFLSGALYDIVTWTQGLPEDRPSAFNRHLKEARRRLP